MSSKGEVEYPDGISVAVERFEVKRGVGLAWSGPGPTGAITHVTYSHAQFLHLQQSYIKSPSLKPLIITVSLHDCIESREQLIYSTERMMLYVSFHTCC